MNHATIDIETIDTVPQSTILSVGGVKFNPKTFDDPTDQLYFKISIDDQHQYGRTHSDSAISWWASKQDPAVMEEAFDQSGALLVVQALDYIRKWLVGVDVLWAQGYGFDYIILEDMYRGASQPIPWNFWQLRDSRTLFSLCKSDPRKQFTFQAHNAGADAYYQSKAIQLAYKELGIN